MINGKSTMFLKEYVCVLFFLDKEEALIVVLRRGSGHVRFHQLYSKWPQMVFRRFTLRQVRDTYHADFSSTGPECSKPEKLVRSSLVAVQL